MGLVEDGLVQFISVFDQTIVSELVCRTRPKSIFRLLRQSFQFKMQNLFFRCLFENLEVFTKVRARVPIISKLGNSYPNLELITGVCLSGYSAMK